MGADVRLTRRAREVAELIALGLTNREIASRLFLSERTVEWHVEQIKNKLGFATRSQVAAWVGRSQLDLAVSKPKPNKGNLPAAMTSFVGRDRELRGLLDLVSANRLVTIAGAGGTGKTRLALRLAEELEPDFPDGVWLCDLTPVSDPGLVGDALAHSLGLKAAAADVVVSLQERFRDRSALVVLDNCEHVLASSAEIAKQVLEACHGVRILTTSRIPLAVIGEAVWRLEPLPHGDAVRLFEDRASAAVAGFDSREASADAIDAICRHLDGVPLAIELVVPRLRVQTAAHLAAAVLDPAWQRRSSQRHGSLEALVDWSYRLMAPDEKALFRLLGVFAGWFDAADAAGLAPATALSVAVLLGSLAEQSMIVQESGGEDTRYRLLEVLKTFAIHRLEVDGELDAARRLHAHHVLHLVPGIDAQPVDGPARRAKVMSTMVDDVRAALRVLLKTNPRQAAWLSASMMPAWSLSGRIAEGLQWSGLALQANVQPNRERCWNLFTHGMALGELRRVDEAEPYLLDAESIADAPGNDDLRTETLIVRATCCDFVGKHLSAIELRAERIDGLQSTGDEGTLAVAFNHQAMSLLFAGRPAEAADCALRSLAIEQRLHSGRAAYPLETLAEAHLMRGELRDAHRRWLDVLEECIGRWDSAVVPASVFGLALVAGLEDRLDEAIKLYYLAVRLQDELDAPYWEPVSSRVDGFFLPLLSGIAPETAEKVRSEGRLLTPEMVLSASRPGVSVSTLSIR